MIILKKSISVYISFSDWEEELKNRVMNIDAWRREKDVTSNDIKWYYISYGSEFLCQNYDSQHKYITHDALEEKYQKENRKLKLERICK